MNVFEFCKLIFVICCGIKDCVVGIEFVEGILNMVRCYVGNVCVDNDYGVWWYEVYEFVYVSI